MKIPGLLFLLTLFMVASIANASHPSKPFAEKHVVLQISNSDVQKQTHVLNVANNLIKHYGPDKIDVEIVAFGPGLRLLLKDNSNTPRIDGLANNGVRFAACSNTLTAFTKIIWGPARRNVNVIM